jgi:hypothetical protein
MTGASEVPPVTTPARGAVKFNLSRDGSTLQYKLTAARIRNVVGAHIHVAQPGVDRPIVVDLMDPAGTKIGRRKTTMRGVITAADLTGPMAGLTLADLVAQMNAGATYVNVHTDDNVPPPDTAPGDYPGGEIRGQVHRLGRRFQTANPINPTPNPMPGY